MYIHIKPMIKAYHRPMGPHINNLKFKSCAHFFQETEHPSVDSFLPN